MSDDPNEVLLVKPQAGQPAQASASKEPSKPSYDPTELAAMIDERLENFSRKQQSQLDKLEARVQKQVKALRAAGVEPTPEMERAIRQTVQDDELPVTAQPSASKAAQPKPQENGNPADVRVAIRDDLYDEYGFGLEAGDPELATVDSTKTSKLVETLRKALEAKKARTDADTARQASGRLPLVPIGGPASNPIGNITDPGTLIKMGLNQK